MAKKNIVFRDGVKIIGTPGDGTGDPILTRDAIDKEVGESAPIGLGVFLDVALPEGQIFIGNSSNLATPQQVTGSVTITPLGVTSITPNSITNTQINSSANIDYSKLNLTGGVINADISPTASITRTKLAIGNPWRVLINDASGIFSEANAITGSRLLVSDANGIPVAGSPTATEASYLSGTTSNIQTQFFNKLSFSGAIIPSLGSLAYYNGSAWVNFPRGSVGQVLTSTPTTIQWSLASSNGLPAGGTTGQYLAKINATDYNVQWDTLTVSKITDLTATASELNILDGATITAANLNLTAGGTSNFQVQLDNKLSTSLAYNALYVGNVSNIAVQLSPGNEGEILTMVGGSPIWQPPVGGGGGDITSVGSSTDNAIVRWNGTLANSIQNSGVIIDDTDIVSGVTTLIIVDQGGIQLREDQGSGLNYVQLRAAATMASNYNITFPAAAPGSNTFLKYDGANYVWSTGGTGATEFTALTDAPSSYVGQGTKVVAVNSAETALEFIDSFISTFSNESFQGDDATTIFTLTEPSDLIITIVAVGGVLYEQGVQYTKNDTTKQVTFFDPPPATQRVNINYITDLVAGSITLTNGEGTTANGTAVDLGGSATADITLAMAANSLTVDGTVSGALEAKTTIAAGTALPATIRLNTTVGATPVLNTDSAGVLFIANGTSLADYNMGSIGFKVGSAQDKGTFYVSTYNTTLNEVFTIDELGYLNIINAPATSGSFSTSTILTRETTGNVTKLAASGGGTTNYLRADGTWTEPPGTTGVSDGDKGDITVSGIGTIWTIDAGVVTYSKIQDVSATNRLLGRITGGAGSAEELTGTQVTTLLDLFTPSLQGLVPLSGGGTTNFLRADGTWSAPPGGGGGGGDNTDYNNPFLLMGA